MITYPIVATHRNGDTKLFYNLDEFRRFAAMEIVGEKFNQPCNIFPLKFKYSNWKGYVKVKTVLNLSFGPLEREEKYYQPDWVVRDDCGRNLPHEITPLFKSPERFWSSSYKMTMKNMDHALEYGGPIPWTGVSKTKIRQYYRREGEGRYTTKGGKGAYLRSKIIDNDY